MVDSGRLAILRISKYISTPRGGFAVVGLRSDTAVNMGHDPQQM